MRPPDAGGIVAAAAFLQLPQPPQVAGLVEHRVGDGGAPLVARRQEVGRHRGDDGRGHRRRGERREDPARSGDDDRRRRSVEQEIFSFTARHEVLQRRCVVLAGSRALHDSQRADSDHDWPSNDADPARALAEIDQQLARRLNLRMHVSSDCTVGVAATVIHRTLQLATLPGTTRTPRSTQSCIPPGSLNRVPASAGVEAGLSPLPGGR